MADLYGFAEAEGLVADGVELAFVDVPDVGGEGGGEVAAGRDVAVVVVELVGAGNEVVAVFEAEVEDHIREPLTEVAPALRIAFESSRSVALSLDAR